jgi:hypothetical protein
MSDIVRVTRHSLGSRGKNSIGGAVFGVLLVAVAVFLLFYNEGRSVKRYKDLKEGAGAVVTVTSEAVDPATEGKLIHFTGDAKTVGPLVDATFGISVDAIRLERTAEMYQWVEEVRTEETKNVGGSTDVKKTYSYSNEWREGVVDSSRFEAPQNHQNPISMPHTSGAQNATGVTVGAFQLPAFLIDKIRGSERFPIESLDRANREVQLAKLSQGGLYFGSDPNNPDVGDIRIRFEVVRPGPVSVVAQQKGNTLVSYQAKTGGTVDLLSRGEQTAEEMFRAAQDANKSLTWALRVLGFVLLGIAFSMIFRPLVVFADVLPFLGRIVGAGTTFISFLLAGVVWALTVSVAWIFYRPLLGVAIFVLAVALLVLLIRKVNSVKARQAVAANPNIPNPSTPPPLS